MCVFSLQDRAFGSGPGSGQGVAGPLHPAGHSLRRTPRWGKKPEFATQILHICPFISKSLLKMINKR